MGKDLVKQNITFLPNREFYEYLAGWPFSRDTHENLQPGMTLHLPVMCSTCGFFAGKLLARHSRNSLIHPLKLEFSHSLTSILYNWKPTYIQGYMIEEITIKFGLELKPTQNSCKLQLYNLPLWLFCDKTPKQTLDLNMSLGT